MGDVGPGRPGQRRDRRRGAAAGLSRRQRRASSTASASCARAARSASTGCTTPAPARLARLAREAGVERFIHISAIGADPRSTSAYARTKAAGEQAVRDAFPTATILRPSVVFGPEDQFFNRFAAMAMMSPVAAADRRRRDAVPAGLCRRCRRCGGRAASTIRRRPARTYELGGPKIYTFRELMELLLAEIRRKRLVDRPAVRARRAAGAADVAAAEPAADRPTRSRC